MTHECKLALIVEGSGERVSVSGEFQDDEWEHLEEFAQYGKELLETKLVQSGSYGSLKIRWDAESGKTTFVSELPPWDDVTVFLHKFRPIGLDKEDTSFYKICGLLTKVLSQAHFRDIIGEQREIYSGKRLRSMFQIQVDDAVLNSEEVLHDWLNSYEYHRDRDKREFIESLHEVIPVNASKVVFLGLLSEKTIAISNVASIALVVLGKQMSIKSSSGQSLERESVG